MDGGGSSGGGAPVRSRGASLTPSSPSISTASASTSSFKNRLISNPRPPSSPFSDNDTATDEDPMDEEDDFEDIATTAVAINGNGNADELDTRSSSMRTFNSARFSEAKNNKKSEVKVEAETEIPTGVVVKDEGTKGTFTESVQASGAYSAREEGLKREELAGRLKFTCCANDGVDEHMIWLIGLKNIFSRQLPNMPKEYIVRLVMDTTHKSMMVIRNNQVVGGITYRPYVSQKFGEIAFCAITSDEQVKGYGTRLMNYLKQHARDVDGLTHFLTYADNNAVGYFVKQGFTKEITLDKERWYGYIKDYDGGILMECKIDPKLPYTDLSTMIRRQRQAIDEKIRELSNCHIVYPGIDFQKKEAGIPRKPIKVEDIPGLKEAGWTLDQYGHSRYKAATVTDSAAYREQLNDFMRALLKAMNDHPDAWPFREPVDARDVPDYYDVIKDPMDLKTMAKRLESEQYYITFEMFFADVKRMLSNARTYNSPETIYYKCATRLENFFTNKVQNQLNHANQSNLKNTISIADF